MMFLIFNITSKLFLRYLTTSELRKDKQDTSVNTVYVAMLNLLRMVAKQTTLVMTAVYSVYLMQIYYI